MQPPGDCSPSVFQNPNSLCRLGVHLDAQHTAGLGPSKLIALPGMAGRQLKRAGEVFLHGKVKAMQLRQRCLACERTLLGTRPVPRNRMTFIENVICALAVVDSSPSSSRHSW